MMCGPHRGPEGPNEVRDVCPYCGCRSYRTAAEDDYRGEHVPECNVPPDHGSWCRFDMGRAITDAINADPAEVARLRRAQEEARSGRRTRWRP